jgi:hypothetical protein
MRSLLIVSSFVGLAALASTRAEARCAMYGLAPRVLDTPARLPAGGGLVVGYEDVPQGKLGTGDVAVQSTWRFVIGSRRVAPEIVSLAPGLAVYRLAERGAATLEDGHGRTLATLAPATGAPATLAAPRARRVVVDRQGGRRSSTRVTIELAGAVPDTAIALVAVDAKGKPLSWGRARAGASQVVVHAAARCRALPNGTRAPSATDQVSLFWVDHAGGTSPASKPIAVVAARAAGVADDE